MLSRGLNNLNNDAEFVGYGLPKWSLKVNHLAYADNIILLSSGDRKPIIKMMNVLKDYEDVSG